MSWIRVRDHHILTVDRANFIADERFHAFNVDETGYWTLQIKYVQGRDAGLYECQVSTEPKISTRVGLQVVVPRTEIIGDPDRFVKSGSSVKLRCIIRGALEPPAYIIWYHGVQQLFTDNSHYDIKIDRGKIDQADGGGGGVGGGEGGDDDMDDTKFTVKLFSNSLHDDDNPMNS